MHALDVYVCTDHDGHFSVGVASIVVAGNESLARSLLVAALKAEGLDGSSPFTLTKIDTAEPRALVLRNGDY